VADQLPGLTDDEIELLRRLSSDARSLAEALTRPRALASIDTEADAKPNIDMTARELSHLMAKEVRLLQDDEESHEAFATNNCLALNPALLKIARDRDLARARATRQRRLEWLQLASCLDKEKLRIGAYPAHAERFLESTVDLMSKRFPWVDCRLEIERRRARVDRFRGYVQDDFDSGRYDFIMVPRERGPVRLRTVYAYSFRVIGAPAKMDELIGKNNIIRAQKLRGEKLIIAPAETSSRRRLRDLFLQEGIDIEVGSIELLEETEPISMRDRAEHGEGLALVSDEYAAIGGRMPAYPCLALGRDDEHATIHKVEMGLLRQRSARMPRHQAFDFVVEELISAEKERDRAAAQN
jgi:hypothetical protein